MSETQKQKQKQKQTAVAGSQDATGSAVSQRDKGIWRAALTLAHNMCTQDSDRVNDNDGPLEAVHALSDEAKRIRGWLEPSDGQLSEMLLEAGVPEEGWAQIIRSDNAPVMLATMIGALLIKHKVIDQAALDDPEGYDKGHTARGILLTVHDLLDFLEDRIDESPNAQGSGTPNQKDGHET